MALFVVYTMYDIQRVKPTSTLLSGVTPEKQTGNVHERAHLHKTGDVQ